MTFKELNLKEEILSAIEELGFESPMPVQEKVIPFMLENDADLVALAQTGTGKTAAFGLPILNMIDPNLKQVQALVLSPTRELCIQISNDLKNFSKFQKTRVVPVYGGEDIRTQLKQLDSTPQIIVATPGRLIDLIDRGKIKLENIRYLVLDEADEMLKLGFMDDLEVIFEAMPASRQSVLFSATLPHSIRAIAEKHLREPQHIKIASKTRLS